MIRFSDFMFQFNKFPITIKRHGMLAHISWEQTKGEYIVYYTASNNIKVSEITFLKNMDFDIFIQQISDYRKDICK